MRVRCPIPEFADRSQLKDRNTWPLTDANAIPIPPNSPETYGRHVKVFSPPRIRLSKSISGSFLANSPVTAFNLRSVRLEPLDGDTSLALAANSHLFMRAVRFLPRRIESITRLSVLHSARVRLCSGTWLSKSSKNWRRTACAVLICSAPSPCSVIFGKPRRLSPFLRRAETASHPGNTLAIDIQQAACVVETRASDYAQAGLCQLQRKNTDRANQIG